MSSGFADAPMLRPGGRVDPDCCICLLCFGRGGSNIVTNLIQNSPDVHSVVIEWHRNAFKNLTPVRKALHRSQPWTRRLPSVVTKLIPKRMLSRFWRRRCADDLNVEGRPVDPKAKFIHLKVMDYNIPYLPAIALAYPTVKALALARDPVAQVESLMRSGSSIDRAIKRYNDVAISMAAAGVPIVRFEDMLADPVAFAYGLHDMLGITRCAPDGFELKVKPFGDARQSGTNVSTKTHASVRRRSFNEAELRAYIAPDVNEKALARLSAAQIAKIRAGTAAGAAALGYQVDQTPL